MNSEMSVDEAIAQASRQAFKHGFTLAPTWPTTRRMANGTLIVTHALLWSEGYLEHAMTGVPAKHRDACKGAVADGVLRGLVAGNWRGQVVVEYVDGTLISVQPAPRNNTGGVPDTDHWQAVNGTKALFALSPLRAVSALKAQLERENNWRNRLVEQLVDFDAGPGYEPAYSDFIRDLMNGLDSSRYPKAHGIVEEAYQRLRGLRVSPDPSHLKTPTLVYKPLEETNGR
jgi:hypothetical protein